jgi:hypothetical protein
MTLAKSTNSSDNDEFRSKLLDYYISAAAELERLSEEML